MPASQQAVNSTAFDNGDICDIDKQLSLNVKVPVQAPSILRKTTAANATTSNNPAGSTSGLCIAKNSS